MAKPKKRSALEALTKRRLVQLIRTFELQVSGSRPKVELIDALARSKSASFKELLKELNLAELKDICRTHELDASGDDPAKIAARILGADSVKASANKPEPNPGRHESEQPSISAPEPELEDTPAAESTDFSATDSALGYLYQVRLALLFSLRRLAEDTSFTVYFETLDDVVFQEVGSPVELLQLKHHCERAANLTDASPDLWKTLRVWMEGRANGTIAEDGQLFLITTSAAGSGSAASMIQAENRDVGEATKRLLATAATSTNQTNTPAYVLFRGLARDERTRLLKSVIVVPQAPSIDETGSALRQEARLAVRREHLESFMSRLEGWWFGRALRQMIAADTPPILSSELESELDDLREQFKLDALPVDQDILNAEVDAAAYENAVFVHQAKLTGVGNRRILAAIRDYYRAFEQRSRWMREDLLLVGELDRYERHLYEEWELEFDRVADEIGNAATEDAKRTAAQVVYTWVEKSCFPIREKVKHPSMSRGSLHILADRMRVGWHPDFMERLKHILEPKGEVS